MEGSKKYEEPVRSLEVELAEAKKTIELLNQSLKTANEAIANLEDEKEDRKAQINELKKEKEDNDAKLQVIKKKSEKNKEMNIKLEALRKVDNDRLVAEIKRERKMTSSDCSEAEKME